MESKNNWLFININLKCHLFLPQLIPYPILSWIFSEKYAVSKNSICMATVSFVCHHSIWKVIYAVRSSQELRQCRGQMKSTSGLTSSCMPWWECCLLTVTRNSVALLWLLCLGNNLLFSQCACLHRFSFAPSSFACLCSYSVEQLVPLKFAGILLSADPHCGRGRTANYWIMRQDPNQKISHSISASESWVMFSVFWLGVEVLFILSLSTSFSLNPSGRAEEIKRGGKKSPLLCNADCWAGTSWWAASKALCAWCTFCFFDKPELWIPQKLNVWSCVCQKQCKFLLFNPLWLY